jgi:hypothetical protein
MGASWGEDVAVGVVLQAARMQTKRVRSILCISGRFRAMDLRV